MIAWNMIYFQNQVPTNAKCVTAICQSVATVAGAFVGANAIVADVVAAWSTHSIVALIDIYVIEENKDQTI